MSRPLSAAARRGLNAAETGEVYVVLLTLAHDDLEAPIRVVNDIVEADVDGVRKVVSRGNDFLCYPFEITLPGDEPDRIDSVTLRIDNVERDIVEGVRALASPPAVTLEVALASSPDTVEAGPFTMSLVSAQYDALVIEGTLAYEDVLREPFPGDSYIPRDYAGLF